MNNKCYVLMLVLAAVAVGVTWAAPKANTRAKINTEAKLGDVELTGMEELAVEQSAATLDKRNKQLDLDFQANNLGARKSQSTRRLEDTYAQLKARDNVASVVGSRGANVRAEKQGNGRVQAQTGKHSSEGKFTKTANGHDGVLTAKGKTQQVSTNKKEKVYTANNAKVETKLDAETHTKTEGNGQISVAKKNQENKFYLYEVARSADGKSYDGKIADLADAPGRVRKQWTCTAAEAGESTCVDQNGRKVGKVIIDDQGNTAVYNKRGIAIGRGKATKSSDGEYRVSVNKESNSKVGLFAAEIQDMETRSCYKEVTGKRERKMQEVEIKDVKFEYNSERNANGSRTIAFPDCFDVVANVKLASTVVAEDVAVEFEARVNPLGPLQCMSAATCGRKCYYCNLCEATKNRKDGTAAKVDAFDNIRSNICTAKGGRWFELRTTVCPPPEDTKSAQCASFDKSLVNSALWGRHKSIEGRVLLWQRPKNEESLKKKYFAVMDKGNAASRAIERVLTAQFALRNPGVEWNTITQNEKLDFYVRHYGKEKLLACKHSEADYNLGGQKVDSDFLISAANTMRQSQKGDLSLFSDKPCDEWVALQEREYAADKAEYSKSGGLLGGLLDGLLSGRGQRRS